MIDLHSAGWDHAAMTKRAIALPLMLVSLPIGSLAQPKSAVVMSAQEKVVLSYFHDVLDGGKVELIDSLFQPDCAIHRPEGESKGLAPLRAMAQTRKTGFSSFHTEIREIFEAGDRVVVRLTHTVAGAGPYRFRIGTYDISGKTVVWDAIVIFRMQNGKIAEEWVSRDELGMLLSAGVLVPRSDAH
jgi:predicted ester cyclase